MDEITTTLQRGLEAQQSGDLRSAEQAYRQVLQQQPANPHALYLLGTIALQVGQFQAAVQCLSAAIRIHGSQSAFHSALGDALLRLGQVADAIASFRQAARLNPADSNLHNSLGAALQSQGDVEGALACYREALAIDPANATALLNLGAVLKSRGQLTESLEALDRAAGLQPERADIQLHRGDALFKSQRLDEAAASFESAVQLQPNVAQYHYFLGIVYQAQRRFAEAAESYRRAVAIAPNHFEAHSNLGTALEALQRPDEAHACYLEAVHHNPSFALAHVNLSGSFFQRDRPDEAVVEARTAIEQDPACALAYAKLGSALRRQGDTPAAIEAFRRAIDLNPDDVGTHSNLLYALNCLPDVNQTTLFAEHRAWAARHAEPLTAAAIPPARDRDLQRRLRVGYVSAHFSAHAVSFFSEPMIAAHDHEQFEVVCYSTGTTVDGFTARFQAATDRWRELPGISDEALAQQVRDDQIDILVDLAGHIGGNHLLAFARRPAPIQVTYLGYQNTTGMSAMDYRLTDGWADPPGTTDPYYTERLIRLPRSFFCYRPPDSAPEVSPPPALAAGHVTFGSLNHVNKLSPHLFRAWARILNRVPRSRLVVLAYAPGELERKTLELFKQEGIDGARLEFVNRRLHYEYLELAASLDVALDSFPFNGHTTICDCLWMGVPSVVMAGDRYAWRYGGTALVNLDMQDWIARDEDQYVERAVAAAGDLEKLSALRASLRERMKNSAIVDAAGFTRNLEQAYRQMWRDWCAKA